MLCSRSSLHDLLLKVLEREGINRVEVGAAVAAAEGDRLDLFAAGRALLGVTPCGRVVPRTAAVFSLTGAFSQP